MNANRLFESPVTYRALRGVLDSLLKVGRGTELSIQLVIELHARKQSLVHSV